MFFQNRKNIIAFSVISVFILASDLISKYLLTNKNFVLIKNVLTIFYKENTGAAGSMLEDKTGLLIVLSIVFIIALFVFDYFLKDKNMFYTISFALVVSGAIGNLYDRIVFGFVRDFIRVDFIYFPYIFNIADMALTVGVTMLCIFFVFCYKPKQKGEK